MAIHEDSLSRFQDWVLSLANATESELPELRRMMAGTSEQDRDATELIWRWIEKKLAEVNAAAYEVRQMLPKQ